MFPFNQSEWTSYFLKPEACAECKSTWRAVRLDWRRLSRKHAKLSLVQSYTRNRNSLWKLSSHLLTVFQMATIFSLAKFSQRVKPSVASTFRSRIGVKGPCWLSNRGTKPWSFNSFLLSVNVESILPYHHSVRASNKCWCLFHCLNIIPFIPASRSREKTSIFAASSTTKNTFL